MTTDHILLERACRNTYAWESQKTGVPISKLMKVDLVLGDVPRAFYNAIRAEYDRLYVAQQTDLLAQMVATASQRPAGGDSGHGPMRDAKGRFRGR